MKFFNYAKKIYRLFAYPALQQNCSYTCNVSKQIVISMILIIIFSTLLGTLSRAEAGLSDSDFVSKYIQKLKKAYGKTPDFPEGEGSEDLIEDFIEQLSNSKKNVKSFLNAQGQQNIKKSAGSLYSKDIVKHYLSLYAKSIDFLKITDGDKVLGNGHVSRRAAVIVDIEIAKIEYSSLIILEFDLRSPGDHVWQIQDIRRIQEDFTVANTSWIYKIFYFLLVISFVLAIIGFFQIFYRGRATPATIGIAGRRGLISAIFVFILFYGWISFVFPRVYMSHVGFYWGLSLVCGMVAQNLTADNIHLHYHRIPGVSFIAWLLALFPLLVFFSMPEKFTPAQTSSVDMVYRLPSKVKAMKGNVAVRDAAIASGMVVKVIEQDADLTYIDKVVDRSGEYYKIITEDSIIGYVPVEDAKIIEEVRKFDRESDFLDVIVRYLRPPQPIDLPVDIGVEVGQLYFKRGMKAANRSSIKDHMEAMSQFYEALKYSPVSEDIHLAMVSSVLEVNRRLLRNNMFNVFGIFYDSAVSYNKIKALSANSILYLTKHVTSVKNLNERDGLLGLSYMMATEDDDLLEKIRKIKPQSRYSRFVRLMFEKDEKKALSYVEELIRNDPKSSLFLSERGTVLLALDQTEKAKKTFDRALALGPNNEIALLGSLASSVDVMENEIALKLSKKASEVENNFNAEARIYGLIIKYGFNTLIFIGISIGLIIVYLFSTALSESVLGTLIKVFAIAILLGCLTLSLYYFQLDSIARNTELLQQLIKKLY